jgi:hypothetical protein
VKVAPEVVMVSFAVFDGPIIAELAVLLVMFEPKAEAPEAEAVLLYPKAEEYEAEAVLMIPKAEELFPEAMLMYPEAEE